MIYGPKGMRYLFFSVLKEIFSGRLLCKLFLKVHIVAIRVPFYFTVSLMNVKVVFHIKKTRKRFYWTYRWHAVYKKLHGKKPLRQQWQISCILIANFNQLVVTTRNMDWEGTRSGEWEPFWINDVCHGHGMGKW